MVKLETPAELAHLVNRITWRYFDRREEPSTYHPAATLWFYRVVGFKPAMRSHSFRTELMPVLDPICKVDYWEDGSVTVEGNLEGGE